MGLYGRAQPKEEGFGESRHLGGVVHVDDQVSPSGTFYVREVGRLGLEILEYGWIVSGRLPSLIILFPVSMGIRNVSMKRMHLSFPIGSLGKPGPFHQKQPSA